MKDGSRISNKGYHELTENLNKNHEKHASSNKFRNIFLGKTLITQPLEN